MVSNSNLLLLLASSLLLFSFIINLASAKENDDLHEIRVTCDGTTYPDLCFSILAADPRSKGKEYPELTAIAIDLAIKRGVATRTHIASLQKKNTDPVLEQILEACFLYYDDGVVHGTSVALEEYNKSEYVTAAKRISASASAARHCDKPFAKQTPRKNVLKDLNRIMIQHLTVADDLVNAFTQG